ncbi:MAG: O-antigen ligase family protein [Alphaproteobacteria bacterium]
MRNQISHAANTAAEAPRALVPVFWVRIRFLYAVLGMVFYQGAVAMPLRWLRGAPLTMQQGESDVSLQIGQALILFGLFIFGWKHRRQVPKSLILILPITLILGLCTVSTLWSGFPEITIRRSVTLLSCIAFGIYCYCEFGLWRAVELMTQITIVLAALSLAVYFLIPSLGHDVSEGYSNALRGIYGQKNFVGAAMLLALNFGVCKAFYYSRLSLFDAVGLLLMLSCLVLSSSATAIGVFAIVFAMHLMNYSRRHWRLRVVLLYVFGVMAFILVCGLVVSPATMVGAIGRDLSFTGRVPLWQASIQAIAAKPILGYGYAAFWNADSTLTQYIWERAGWAAAHAHDAYIDLVLQVGLVGLVLYVLIWGRIFLLAKQGQRYGNFPEAHWALGIVVSVLIRNLDEGGELTPDTITMLMTIALLALESWRRGVRPRAMASRAQPQI